MLDLRSKLAAAGLVTKEQVKALDDKDVKDRDAKLARQAKRDQERMSESRDGGQRDTRGPKQSGRKPSSGGRQDTRSPRSQNGQKRGPQNQGNRGGRPNQARPSHGIDIGSLKKLNRGDAYTRIRPIVDRYRLDDKERLIPKPDDKIFNFVTCTGSIGRLYLAQETVDSVSAGKSAISSFMSHHGLSHCVLPRDVALALAEVFPLWLRQLRDHPQAGLIEDPEETERKRSRKRKTPEGSEAKVESASEAKAETAPEAGSTDTSAETDQRCGTR